MHVVTLMVQRLSLLKVLSHLEHRTGCPPGPVTVNCRDQVLQSVKKRITDYNA